MWLRRRSRSNGARLTVSIHTRNSEPHLGRLLDEVGSFADEIVVGVDADSVDRTLEVAAAGADVVYRFRHRGNFAPVRFLRFDYATGDWILSLDDDESIEESFDDLMPELLNDPRPTHYFLPRKWIVSLDPCEYLYDSGWSPDWAARLFRNDRRLFWKPPRAHTDSILQGLGYREERVSILHFEQLLRSPKHRQEKLAVYRNVGAGENDEKIYYPPNSIARRAAVLRRPRPPLKKRQSKVHREIREPKVVPFPNWRFELLKEDTPRSAACKETIRADIQVRNLGQYWSPNIGRWPRLSLSYHLLDSHGSTVTFENSRFPVMRPVDTGKTVTFLCDIQTPDFPGNYQLEWDMVSDGDVWFALLGAQTYRTPIQIV